MSDQSETTANTPSQPQPCKSGCGFFGSNATGDMCSKCWREKLQREGKADATPVSPSNPVSVSPVVSTPALRDLGSAGVGNVPAVNEVKPPVAMKPRRKKKKASYKAMMAGMKQGSQGVDIEKEKEKLREVTGGGTFSKIDKI